ncbi:MAG: glycosyltransferase [Alphaproteobacteria bacterium]
MRIADGRSIGRRLMAEQRFAEAEAAFEAALRRCPDDPEAHYLRGEALFLQRRLDEALECHAAAARLAHRKGTDLGGAMSGIVPGDFGWMSHMLRGDFESAWRLADEDRARRLVAGITGADWPRHMRPVWDGARLSGARVLVRCYHGLGDTIQFARYLPLLAGRAARVCVEAQPELIPLLQGLPGVADIVKLGAEDHPPGRFGCDAEIDMTEMPHAFRTRLDTIPAAIPYLSADHARSAAAARRLSAIPGRLRAGLVWAAGEWKPERSMELAQLAPLAAIPGIALVNLQRGPEYRRWRDAPSSLPLVEAFETDAVADAAATVANLDLVITVDTMVAHLAGALGVPALLMLHFAADWRWLLDRSDSPWYPTMRLFRQPRPGDWTAVVNEVSAALRSRSNRAQRDAGLNPELS